MWKALRARAAGLPWHFQLLSPNFYSLPKMRRGSVGLIIFSFLLGATLFTALFFYLDPQEVLQVAKTIKPWKIVVYLLVASLPLAASLWRWQYILRQMNLPFSVRQLLGPKLAGLAVSFLTPIAEVGGAPVRLLIMRQNYRLPWGQNIASVFLDSASELLVHVFISGVGLVILLFYLKLTLWGWISGAGLALFLAWLGVIYRNIHSGQRFLERMVRVLRLDRLKFSKAPAKHIKQAEELAAHFITRQKKAFLMALGFSLLVNVFSLVEIGTLLFLLGVPVNLFEVYLVKVLMNIAYVLPVPAALGVAEWSQAGFFSAAGLGASTGALFSLIYKSKDFFFAALGILIIVYAGLQFLALLFNNRKNNN